MNEATPTTTPDAPSAADLTPEQIADALRELAERDTVSIDVYATPRGRIEFRVFEWSGDNMRSGHASTYEAALSACRASDFGKAVAS